jgi:NADH-quinone oxidoreductase subunit L
MNTAMLVNFLGFSTVVAPLLLLLVIGCSMLFQYKLSEVVIGRWMKGTMGFGLITSVSILAIMLLTRSFREVVDFGNLVTIEDVHFHFHLSFIFDRLSVPMVILSLVLCFTIGSFGISYLHRDNGFHRFFLFFSMFAVGMVFASLAATIETLFLGWEFVGLSSALLIAYFHERVSPVANGLRVWTVYRIADAAFLAAAVLLHHETGEGQFIAIMSSEPWPYGVSTLDSGVAFWAGLLLLIAAAGKSGLIPFSGWLPRAMEGPTPSSAVFYGALSVHLGAFLLLRISPIIDQSFSLRCLVIAIGLITAVYSAFTARVQTDVKSSLAFASLTQVSLIVVEIGCGFLYLALIHMIGHACLRTLQLLRAPTLLRDYKTLENALGSSLSVRAPVWIKWTSPTIQRRLYRAAIERGYLDAILYECLAKPFLRIFNAFDRLERSWICILSGEPLKATSKMRHMDANKRTLSGSTHDSVSNLSSTREHS